MASLTERKPGVWFARVFVPTSSDAPPRQVGRLFRGNKKAVRAEVAAWEAEVRGRAPASVGATVADLLEMWQEAKAHTWQPTTVREYRGRAAMVSADIGTVRLLDLDPLRIDVWLREMRRRPVGEGAMRGRVSTLKAAASWGVSRRC